MAKSMHAFVQVNPPAGANMHSESKVIYLVHDESDFVVLLFILTSFILVKFVKVARLNSAKGIWCCVK